MVQAPYRGIQPGVDQAEVLGRGVRIGACHVPQQGFEIVNEGAVTVQTDPLAMPLMVCRILVTVVYA